MSSQANVDQSISLLSAQNPLAMEVITREATRLLAMKLHSIGIRVETEPAIITTLFARGLTQAIITTLFARGLTQKGVIFNLDMNKPMTLAEASHIFIEPAMTLLAESMKKNGRTYNNKVIAMKRLEAIDNCNIEMQDGVIVRGLSNYSIDCDHTIIRFDVLYYDAVEDTETNCPELI